MIERLTDPYSLPALEEPMAMVEYKQLLLEQHLLWRTGKTTIISQNKPANPRANEIQQRMDELWPKLSKENKEYMFQISSMLMSETFGPSKEAQVMQKEIDSFEEGNE